VIKKDRPAANQLICLCIFISVIGSCVIISGSEANQMLLYRGKRFVADDVFYAARILGGTSWIHAQR
jgi:hypothetical protein